MKVEVGGQAFDLGTTEAMPTIGITDYSRRVTDGFGVTTVVERNFARRMSVRLGLPSDQVDAVHARMAALRATTAQWVADDRYASLSVTGFYKDFSLDLPAGALSYCTLTVEGIAEGGGNADLIGDPAPDGAASTLRMLQPVVITDAVLSASSVPENDAQAWAAGGSYPVGAKVVRAHRIFESLAPANRSDPAASTGAWLDTGPTNRWAAFDQALGTSTTANGSIVVTLSAGAVDAVALLDVVGATVRVQAAGYDQTRPVANGTVPFLNMPLGNGAVTVTVTGPGTVSIGSLLIGRISTLGITEASPTAAITDYSRKEVDDFGDVTVVQRAWAKRMDARALIRTDAIDKVFGRIAAVRAQPSLWIGQAGFESLTIYGFFKDFSIEVGPAVSKLSLSIEGLSKAAPVATSIIDRLNDIDFELGQATGALAGKNRTFLRSYAPTASESIEGDTWWTPSGEVYRRGPGTGVIAIGGNRITIGGAGIVVGPWVPVSDIRIADTQSQVAQARAAVAAILADGILSRDEKRQFAREWQAAQASYTALDQRAAAFGNVASLRAALTTAYGQLAAVIGAISPPYDDYSVDSPIDRGTVEARWASFYTAFSALDVAIAAQTLIVQWSVTGTGGWHADYQVGDLYQRQSVDGGLTFSAPARVVGEDGADGRDGRDGLNGADGAPGAPGANGQTSYLHTAYANAADGSIDFTTGAPGARRYLGVLVDYVAADSTDPAAYAWSLIKGADGLNGADGTPGAPGADGKTTYVHIAYANAANGSVDFSVDDPVGRSYVGFYVDQIVADSTNPALYTWSLVKGADGRDGRDGLNGSNGAPGAPGADGKSSYLHTAYANAADGSVDFTTGEPGTRRYLGVLVDQTIADSTDPTAYSWSLIKGADGLNGSNGAPGAPGADGKPTYVHIAYANAADGSVDFSVDDPAGRRYIGFYVDQILADSTNPALYAWSRVQGDQGPQGIPGTPGADGQTLYTWVAYADSADGSVDFTTGAPGARRYMGLAPNRPTAVEGTDAAAYSWSLIKGADGAQGVPGPPGADGTPRYIWVAYANSADGTADFTTGEPGARTYIGVSPNQVTAIEGTNPAAYSWAKVQGERGAAGENGQRTSFVFRRAATQPATPTSGVTPPAGWSDAPPVQTDPPLPLWQTSADFRDGVRLTAWASPIKLTAASLADLDPIAAAVLAGKARVFRQATPPLAVVSSEGDLWFDTANGDAAYSRGPGSGVLAIGGSRVTIGGVGIVIAPWLPVSNPQAAKAAAEAAAARAVAEAAASDGVLTPDEKRDLTARLLTINVERADLVARATEQGVSAAAYQAAYTALVAYLDTLNLLDRSTNTPIVPATHVERLTAYDAARTALLAKIGDITAANQLWLGDVADIRVAADYTGAIGAGQLPQSRSVRVYLGTVDVTTFSSFAVTVSAGAAVTLDNGADSAQRGTVTLTGLSASMATIDVVATYAGRTLYKSWRVLREDAPPPASGGGSGGGSGSAGSPASVSSYVAPQDYTTHQVLATLAAVTTGAGGRVDVVAPLTYWAESQGGAGGLDDPPIATYLAVKAQYSTNGGGAWTDAPGEEGVGEGAENYFSTNPPKGSRNFPGSLRYETSITGLGGAASVIVRLQGRMIYGTAIVSVSGTTTATPA